MISQFDSILVSGTIAYDQIMDFPGKFVDHFHPEKLHQINISFVLSRLEKQIGGTATNISYNVRLASLYLGNTIPIYVLSAVGKDGKELLHFLNKNGINTEEMISDRLLYCASGTVITDRKDNQIWGYYYGASKSSKKISMKKFSGPKNLCIISADHPEAFLHFQREAIGNNNTYIYDPGMSLTWIKDTDLKQGVLHSAYLVGNDYEIAMILKRLKKTVKALTNRGLKVITTLGEKGVRYESDVEKREVKSYKVKKVVDPTGAGDAWRGGFIAGLTSGLETKDCLKLGNVMASFAVESYGTVNHKPTEKEIGRRIKK